MVRRRIVALVSLVCLMLFGLVTVHVQLSQGQFDLDRMEARAATEQASYQRLRLQVAQLESPEMITTAATERLGMVPAEQVTALAPTANNVALNMSGPLVKDEGVGAGGAATWSDIKPHLSTPAQ